MRTFSVEGTSRESLEAAMAAAMARVGAQATHAGKIDISIGSVIKEEDGTFRVSVNVRAHESAEEDLEDDDETGDGGGRGRNRDSEIQRRRAERISQRVRDEMIYQYHLHSHTMQMDEAADMVRDVTESATLDTVEYTQSMADKAEQRDQDHNPPVLSAGTFDTVAETPSVAAAETGGSRITMLSREVDEVIGLLSLGFYNPPAPEQAMAAQEPAPGAAVFSHEKAEEERERKARLDAESGPMPTVPPTPVQPTPTA